MTCKVRCPRCGGKMLVADWVEGHDRYGDYTQQVLRCAESYCRASVLGGKVRVISKATKEERAGKR